jgi:ABC-type lipoprotein export system ATPase subunit
LGPGRGQIDAASYSWHARWGLGWRVLLCDTPVHRLAKGTRRTHKRHIGFVFQSYHLLDNLTVYENLEVPLSYRNVSRKDRQGMVADVLDRFQIVGKKDLPKSALRWPAQLVGGRSHCETAVILADEPTGNLHSTQVRKSWSCSDC